MSQRFHIPRFHPAGEERIRLAMDRGLPGDDPQLPLRQISVAKEDGNFIVFLGPIDYDGPEVQLWEMELDFTQFSRGRA